MEIAKTRDVKTPTRGTINSAGIDFYVPNDHEPIVVQPGCACFIKSGIQAKVPTNHALIAFNKSGVSLKKRLAVGACVVDADYQGEIHLHLINVGIADAYINPGDKVVQFILLPILSNSVKVVEELADLYETETDRGTGGFGSTGR